VKGKEEVQDDVEHTYGFCTEFLEEAVHTFNVFGPEQEIDYDFWASEDNVHNKRMNLLFLSEKDHMRIVDGGADSCS
jgi:hypothetical protein